MRWGEVGWGALTKIFGWKSKLFRRKVYLGKVDLIRTSQKKFTLFVYIPKKVYFVCLHLIWFIKNWTIPPQQLLKLVFFFNLKLTFFWNVRIRSTFSLKSLLCIPNIFQESLLFIVKITFFISIKSLLLIVSVKFTFYFFKRFTFYRI